MWNLQNILVYLTLLAAVVYLIKKFFLKKKKGPSSACGETDCKCH